MPNVEIKRCAIYTRVSIEALEHEFNSLDAQRESAENFIKSQKHNGWQLLPDHYDDDGFSGSNTERPALKRLLSDVEAGKIDIILLYKMDRLSRSLLDFMNMSEFFEQHNVSFVSVTQDINTSTSSGRMMLNILMAFGQYEREIIADRVRDRTAGAKRRGKYCGGTPVLGYNPDKETKKLKVNKNEAKIVREAFELYNKLASANDVARILNEKGYHTKEWRNRKGKIHPGGEFKADMVYRMLNNPIYIGKVVYKDKTYNGEHSAIIDLGLWDKAQKTLKANLMSSGRKQRTAAVPFKGLLKCGYCGGAMGITYTGSVKKGVRYYYYLCNKDTKRVESECPLVRVPAGDLDRIIIRKMGEVLCSPAFITRTVGAVREYYLDRRNDLENQLKDVLTTIARLREKIAKPNHSKNELTTLRGEFREADGKRKMLAEAIRATEQKISCRDIINALSSLETIWEELFPAERYRLAHLLIDKTTLYEDRMILDIKTHGIRSLAQEIEAKDEPGQASRNEDIGIISLTIPVELRNRGNRRVMLMPGETEDDSARGTMPANEVLIKALAKAHLWNGMLERGEIKSINELAGKVNMDRSYIGRILNLINLSPRLQEAVINGKEPDGLYLKNLRNDLPFDWREQEDMFCS